MRKVLLVCLDNVGDLVFNSALSRDLSRDPELELSLLCKDYTRPLGKLLPGVQQVFAADPFWDKAPSRGKGRLLPFLRVLWSLRKEGFSRAVVSSGDWRMPFFLRLIGVKEVFGLTGRKNQRFLTRALPMPGRQEAVVQGLLHSFQVLLPCGPGEPCYQLERAKLPARESPCPGKRIVILHAFAGSPSRCAPLTLWKGLADYLLGRGFHVIWTGQEGELRTLRAAFPAAYAEDHFIDRWATDLLTLAAVWQHAFIFIGHDSGPLHVAHALSVPVIGIFLPGEPLRTFPQGPVPYKMLHRANPAALALGDVREAFTALEAQLSNG